MQRLTESACASLGRLMDVPRGVRVAPWHMAGNMPSWASALRATAQVERCKNGVVAGLIDTKKCSSAISVDGGGDVLSPLPGTLWASYLDQHDLICVGALVLRCCEPADAFVAQLGRCAGLEVTNENRCEEGFSVGEYVKNHDLSPPWLGVNLRGDAHV